VLVTVYVDTDDGMRRFVAARVVRGEQLGVALGARYIESPLFPYDRARAGVEVIQLEDGGPAGVVA
jgi:hypothetical protein